MAKIAVVEDNDAMRAQLCGFIAQYAQESGHQLDVTAFSDGAQLVEPYRPGFDIIFLDIEMPKLGGMPTAERIRRQDPDVVLVFVTNMAQYAIRGYEVDALDFVLKPVSYYQFSTKLERALQRIQRRRGGQVALQVSGGVQLLDTDDILYLETRDRLLHYHTATDTWSVRGSLLKKRIWLPTTLRAATSAIWSTCATSGACRMIWCRWGRSGWKSAAASARPFWPRWRPMSGVRCRWIHF